MRYSAKHGQKDVQAPAPIEVMIPLLDPVKIYTPKELAAMPLSVMNQAIEAQEAYFILEHTTQMRVKWEAALKFKPLRLKLSRHKKSLIHGD